MDSTIATTPSSFSSSSPSRSPRMRRYLNTLLLALSIRQTTAVSLHDFTPRASNLTPICNALYTAPIVGCAPSDFTGGSCSSSCITALFDLNDQVYDACADSPQNNNGIIQAYLEGHGMQDICPGVLVTTVQPIATTPTPSPSRSSSKEKTTTRHTTIHKTLTQVRTKTNSVLPIPATSATRPLQASSAAATNAAETDAPVASGASVGDSGRETCAEKGGTPFSDYQGCSNAASSVTPAPVMGFGGTAAVLLVALLLALNA